MRVRKYSDLPWGVTLTWVTYVASKLLLGHLDPHIFICKVMLLLQHSLDHWK